MPFIAQRTRELIKEFGIENLDILMPGDRCYVFYKKMVEQWRANPRWTTAHEIYKELQYASLLQNPDDEVAQSLAWQVFFQLYIIPYELKKQEENGDV
jgi:hypothetical protein